MPKVTIFPDLVQELDIPNQSDVTYNTTQVDEQALEIDDLKAKVEDLTTKLNDAYDKLHATPLYVTIQNSRQALSVMSYVGGTRTIYLKHGLNFNIPSSSLSSLNLSVGDKLLINGVTGEVEAFGYSNSRQTIGVKIKSDSLDGNYNNFYVEDSFIHKL